MRNAEKHHDQISQKKVFLLCCEPVLFHVFHAQNRVQLEWPKMMLNRRQLDYQGLYARVLHFIRTLGNHHQDEIREENGSISSHSPINGQLL